MISRPSFVAPGILFLSFVSAQQSGSRSVWEGVYTENQSNRGEAGYRLSCAKCHGDTLTGGEAAPPLTGGEFLANWNGLTMGDLFERIRVSMPADNPGALKSGQNADILAYLLHVNQFPAGKTELEPRTEILKQIRLDAIKPGDGK